MKFFLTLTLLFTISCAPAKFSKDDSGKLYLNGKLYSGKYQTNHGEIKVISTYDGGIKNGEEVHYFKSGNVFKKWYFKNNQPEGENWTFYKSGKKKKKTVFVEGNHDGDYVEWYENGQVMTYTKFEKGKVVGHKKWRENGQVYANYIVKDGKNIGLTGGKLCFSKEDEK